jgi:23S rRNA U2552 (ribose-2'-O)-methylase RlmE/FtsJ
MSQADSTNPQFELAVQFVNNTAQHIFLTGKAGTGKTTFLKYIRDHTHKKLAIVAPTGIAAINAGGVTLHSFFQLPFGGFIPSENGTVPPSGNFFNRYGLLKQLRLTGMKRRIIQELDLLVIDEVSMVRSDLLDAVDVILRHVRKRPTIPFGGLQMLFIGDLLQLPPVVDEQAWATLRPYYASPFFFDAQVLKASPPHYLELKKIYRQSDENFIGVLNRLRNNQVQPEDLELLNSFYRPAFKPASEGEYITLTTHNSKAEEINQRALKKLEAKSYTYKAEVTGEFNEKSVMAEVTLLLKAGAQVMFIRNDKGEHRRFFNGKLGTVSKLEANKICVVFPDTKEEIQVEKETWKNVRYSYHKEADTIQEEVLGTFAQYPLRLAWAITIHKSQGLTFTKAIIDAGESFAPGQVYVALSRLTSLEGLVLHSRIHPDCINTDDQALAYALSEQDNDTLRQHLKEGQKEYIHGLLLEVFNFEGLYETFDGFRRSVPGRKLSSMEEAVEIAHDLTEKMRDLHKTAEKFIRQLKQLFLQAAQNGYSVIRERVDAAGKYFTGAVCKEVFTALQQHYDAVKKRQNVKQYLKDVLELMGHLKRKKDQMEQAIQLTAGLTKGADLSALLLELRAAKKTVAAAQQGPDKQDRPKGVKGDTRKLSLRLYKEGKSIHEIATERGFTVGTIEGHLVSFISTGEILVHELVKEEKVSAIQKVVEEMGEVSSGLYKERLGPDYSYAEIRAVISHMKINA